MCDTLVRIGQEPTHIEVFGRIECVSCIMFNGSPFYTGPILEQEPTGAGATKFSHRM